MRFSPTSGLTAIAAAAMISTSAFAGGEHWTDDYAQAQATAAQEEKDLLLDFTGSDWCGWCIKLNEEVFAHDVFNDYANDNFVLVELDFPRQTQLSDELKAQNESLRDRYGVTGYPTILLTDAQGLPYASTGYQPGGAEAYVAHLEELKQTRVERDASFAAAEAAEGLDKAQLLHEGLQAMGDEVALDYYEEVVQQVMELDADNEAGIKGHYEMLYLTREQLAAFQAVMRSGNVRENPQATVDAIDAFLEDDAITPQVRQRALATQSQIILNLLQDRDAAKAVLEAAIAIDPDSPMGENLQNALDRIYGDAAE